MKKLTFLVLILGFLVSCKDEPKKQESSESQSKPEMVDGKTAKQNDGLVTLAGDFVYYADAAVLQSGNEVYGVVINDKMHELNKMAEPFKKEATDYVKATVRARILPKAADEEGWPYKLDIQEVLKVEATNPEENNVIKLGSE